uniref:Uncharacterized protein n=1 Tax=Anguilla anguilla TaxID=7936 RepID=A0A0E9SAE7_ANGAN
MCQNYFSYNEGLENVPSPAQTVLEGFSVVSQF